MFHLLTPTNQYNRAAILRRAHILYRNDRSRVFGDHLRYAWRVAKSQRDAVTMKLAA